MRRSAQEVNVRSADPVPLRRWLAHVYFWACEHLYAELAWAYDVVSWLVSAGHWRQWQSGAWAEVRGQKVLELGSGTGALLVKGVRRGKEMVGLDRSAAMLAVTQRRMAAAQVACPLLQGDGRSLPMPDGCFDTVMATFPAGYILDLETLSEMRRVLRPHGTMVIVGLWVAVRLAGRERILPLFYGRPQIQQLEAMARRVADAGFEVRWVEQHWGSFTVGTLVGTATTRHVGGAASEKNHHAPIE